MLFSPLVSINNIKIKLTLFHQKHALVKENIWKNLS